MSFASTERASQKPAIANQLHDEALRMADDSRMYFARNSKTDRAELGAIDRVLYTAESLRISTRLMHVISWTLVRKAVAAGEMSDEEAAKPERQLEDLELCSASDPRDLRKLPRAVVILSHQSLNLYKRAMRLQQQMNDKQEGDAEPHTSPVASMLETLEGALEVC
ncbi:MAG: DUF1465 family protein [Pseudomonadota bacterium]